MRRKPSIPVNYFSDGHNLGIAVERMSIDHIRMFKEANEAHRHDIHSFFLLEKGTISIEIDFKKYDIRSPSIIYMHPNQVHLITAFKNVVVGSCALSNENLNPPYLKWLETITPAQPLRLKKEAFSIISEALSLCIKLSARKQDKLYSSLLKDSCNVLAALVISQYMERPKPAGGPSRAETITKTFNEALEQHYITTKRPADYAKKLHLSTHYLNECVKETTGYTISHHIQQRVILEAKRLLYHSDRTVKQVAMDLGYDDYPYFSRLFTRVAGMTALSFRNKRYE